MAQEFNILTVNPGPAGAKFFDFELPVAGVFGAQTDTYISILTIQPGPGAPAPTTYTIRQRDFGVEVTVPAFGSPPGPLMNGGTKIADVSLVSAVSNGLATIHIVHTTAVSDTQLWQVKVSHTGGGATDFFGVIAHTELDTKVPKLSVIIGSVNPVPLTVDFGKATFNATRKKTAIAFNTGTAPFTLGAVSLTSNPTGFYAITMDPSNTALNPNGQATAEIGYTPVLPPDPPPAPPHTATLNLPAAGLAAKVVNLTGQAMLREIVLLIDASDSMNATSAGARLTSCPVDGNAPGYNASRTRQVRAALQTFQSKLSAYGDKQVFLSIVLFPGGDLACANAGWPAALSSPPSTWQATTLPRTLYDQANPAFAANISSSTEDAFYHATPMTAGLKEAIAKFTVTQATYKAILLLSDGLHNVPADPAQGPLSVMPTLTSPANPIRVCAVGFGNPASVPANLLQQLASQTGAAFGADPLSNQGFYHYDPTLPNNTNTTNLEKYYTEIFADLFQLQGALDPTDQIERGGVKRHSALVTEFDQRVTFTLSWTSPISNLLGFALIAPNGEIITPESNIAQYYEGPKHKMYAVDIDQLPAEYIGEWFLEVVYGVWDRRETHDGMVVGMVFGGPAVEIYNYDVITRSGLELEVKFDRNSYQTGDRVVLGAELTENGRRLPEQVVEVQVQRPGEAMGNWHASHPVGEEAVQAAFEKDFGGNSEVYGKGFKKQYYLTNVAGVALPAQLNAHSGRLAEQYGAYSTVLDGMTTKPGTYHFMVVATGKTSNGNSFRRERLVHIEVPTNVDITTRFTQVAILALAAGEGGLGRFRAYVKPQDAFGNLLGPGFESQIHIHSSLGRPITTEVQDDLVGGYYQDFEYDPNAGTPIVQIAVGDKSLPPQIVGPEIGATGFWKWLFKICPWLARFLLDRRNTNLLLLILLLLQLLRKIFRRRRPR